MKIRQKITLGFASIALLIGLVGYVCLSASQKTLLNNKLSKELVKNTKSAEEKRGHPIFSQPGRGSTFFFTLPKKI